MSSKEPAIISERPLHRGRRFDFVSLEVRQSSGKGLDREIVRHPGAVTVVPVLQPETPGGSLRVVLIRNFRVAVAKRLVECCAGTIERPRRPDGGFVPESQAEDPAACAARELVEETGYRAATLSPLGWFYTSPGLSDEKMYAFLATDLTHVGQDLEDDESIEVMAVAAPEALAMCRDGRIRDGKSICALMLAEATGRLHGGENGKPGDTESLKHHGDALGNR